MPSIDERVVAMSFENSVFEQRVTQTIATLSKLDGSIKNIGNANGLDAIEKAASKVTLSGPMSALDKLRSKLTGAGQGAAEGFGSIDREGNKVTLTGPIRAIDKVESKLGEVNGSASFSELERAADKVTLAGVTRAIDIAANKFSVLQGAATVALGNIQAQAAMKGAAFAKSFAIGPIIDGFKEYQTNLGSIQTILANTQASGATLSDVNEKLQELNHYSDQTIYNFSEMANAIGLFTAAGVDLDTSTASIKGISNLAALSGTNSTKAAAAMQQLAQAISSGKVGLQDWQSVVTAGMGGATFQRALATTASAMGTIKKGALELEGPMKNVKIDGQSFRDSIMAKPGQQSWLTSKVLTTTLQGFTGDLTDAQLAAQGFNGEQIKAIQATAKAAKNAATEVKTLPQVFDVARETVGSGWSQTFQTIFGDFEESKKTFTGMSNALNGLINENAEARNKILDDWKKLGGRTDLIAGFKAAFGDIGAILTPIRDAFRDIFPATTGKQLADFTKQFRQFMENIRPSQGTIDNLQRTFRGLFAALDIGWSIVKGVAGVILDLLGVVGSGGGTFLAFVANIGDFLTALDQAVAKGEAFKGFFKALGAILSVPLRLISAIGKAVFEMFGGGKQDAAESFSKSMDDVNEKLKPVRAVIDVVVDGWKKLVEVLGQVRDALEPWLAQMADKISQVGDVLMHVFDNLDYNKIMSGLQAGFTGGIFLTLKKALGDGLGGFTGISVDAFGGVNKMLQGLTGNLEAMQKKISAETLLLIAASVVALAGGVKLMSTIDGPDLARSMGAVAVGLGELMGAMKLMTMGLGRLGPLMLPFIAAGLIGVATAITILALAMKIFASMKWEEIAKGLAGVAGSIAGIGLALKVMGGGPLLAVQAGGLILLGVALNVIAAAMKQFGAMSLEEIGKSLFVLVDALGGIALVMGLMPPNMALNAAGLILVGIGLASVSGALKAMGSMDLATIVKGLGTMMAAIAGIGLAISLVPPTIALSAAGLLIVGQAMVVTAGAIALLGNLSVGTLVKGIVGLAGALIVLAGGLTLMIVSLPGAVALMVAAGALAVLVPVMAILGSMKWGTIFKSLAAIALVMTTLGVATLIAAPGLALLGVALIPLGLGMLVVAKATQLFAQALSLLSSTGQAGVAVFLTALTGFFALLPTLIINTVKGIVSTFEQIALVAPKIVQALGIIIDQIIAFVITSAPKLAQAIGVLVAQIAVVIARDAPKLVATGVQLVKNLLDGVGQNIGAITDKVSTIIVNFLNALNANMPKLIDAGSRTLRSFLNGVGSRFGEIANTVGNLIVKFITAIGSQSTKIATAAATMMGKLVAAISTFGPTLLLEGSKAILHFLSGLSDKGPEIVRRGVEVARKLLIYIAKGMVDLADIGFKALIGFLNGLEATIRANSDDLTNAGIGVGDAIIDGVLSAISKAAGPLKGALTALFKALPGPVKKVLGIHSPSKVFHEIGRFTMLGFQEGIEHSAPDVNKTADSVGGGLIRAFRDVFAIHSPSEVMRDIGMNVNRGFAQGLKGSAEEVVNAFGSLNDQLRDKIRDLRTQVEDGNSKIQDLQQQHADKLAEIAKLKSEKKPDQDAIKTAVKDEQDLVKQIAAETAAHTINAKALAASRAARGELTKGLTAQKTQLVGLKKEYDELTKTIEEKQGKLDQLQTDSINKQKEIADQYGKAPDIDLEAQDPIVDFKKKLQDRIDEVKKFAATMQKLRDLGLNNELYNKLLAEGPQDQKFADQLALQGKGGVDSLNALSDKLAATSAQLGQQVADNLYKAGINAAQGLVDGLKAKQVELQAQMDALADAMVKAIKAKLKIKSPSRVLMDIGAYTVQGLANGLKATAPVESAAAQLGQTLTAAVSSAISDNIDANPTITPVLDLSEIRKGADEMAGLTNVTPITAAASYGQAASASQEVSASQQAAADAAAAAGVHIELNQTNTSPKALSEVEIYRNTKNQMGQLKGVLGLVN